MTDHLPEYAQSLGSTPCPFKRKIESEQNHCNKKKKNPTLSCQDVSQDERLTAKSDDLKLILGTRLDKGENCFLPIVL